MNDRPRLAPPHSKLVGHPGPPLAMPHPVADEAVELVHPLGRRWADQFGVERRDDRFAEAAQATQDAAILFGGIARSIRNAKQPMFVLHMHHVDIGGGRQNVRVELVHIARQGAGPLVGADRKDVVFDARSSQRLHQIVAVGGYSTLDVPCGDM